LKECLQIQGGKLDISKSLGVRLDIKIILGGRLDICRLPKKLSLTLEGWMIVIQPRHPQERKVFTRQVYGFYENMDHFGPKTDSIAGFI
jgi:hypothetical protein